jgi:regulator of sigma E protease
MEIFLIKALQFMLAIGLLVLLHEGGHFFFAKLFGVKVDKFYLFFDLTVGKWSGKLFSFKPKNSDTEYGVGWLPLGGYCKIAGMIDESFDTEQMKQPEQLWEFRAKPAWQRLLIMIGGVLVNFLLALFIYSMILFYWGESYIRVQDMTMGMKFNQEAKSYGFRDGDILLGTDEKDFKEFSANLYRDISEAHRVDVLRDGRKVSIALPGDL